MAVVIYQRCKDCGRLFSALEYSNYCGTCRDKRKRPSPEIDRKTGEWERV